MSLYTLAVGAPSLAALVLGVLAWYYRRKLKATEKLLDDLKRENANLAVTLKVERKISADRKERADRLNEALMDRQQKEHDADAKISPNDAAAFLRRPTNG